MFLAQLSYHQGHTSFRCLHAAELPIILQYAIYVLHILHTDGFPTVLLHAGNENIKHLFYTVV